MADRQTIGKYQIQGLLKRGGMGLLYLGYDPELERQVAIKVIRTDSELGHLRERFVREAKAVARLRHPNIVTIFEFGTHDGLQFIVMEYIPGPNLAEFIRRNLHEPLAPRLKLIDGACAGLALAHRANIVHRDVKPANLMVDVDGTLKILDFGIARIAGPGLTSAGVIMGTINYMAPEQMTGTRVDHRTDIFAMGAVLYELVSGVRAFPGDRFEAVRAKVLHANPAPLHSICPGIDPPLEAIIGRALAKHPDDRYQDLTELRLELSAVSERLAESASATNARSIVPGLAESDADAATTAPYLPTTAPLKQFAFAPSITRSRWIGLTTGAVILGTVTSVSWKPLPVHAEVPPAPIIEEPTLPSPALPLLTSVRLTDFPPVVGVAEHRAREPRDHPASSIEQPRLDRGAIVVPRPPRTASGGTPAALHLPMTQRPTKSRARVQERAADSHSPGRDDGFM
jgi:serine/threonine protein kinase